MKNMLFIFLLSGFSLLGLCRRAAGQGTPKSPLRDTTRLPDAAHLHDTIRLPDTTHPRDTTHPLDTTQLKDTTHLQDIIIRAEKPLYQQSAEGIIVNADSSVLTKGSSVLAVLERSPGVVIDHRNNSISLNGKSGISIMVDGKVMRLTDDQLVALLSGMSADDLARIELLTTPGARYDAEGNAGMINIVLKKNKKAGTNGSVSVTGGYGWGEKGTGSVNLSHNAKNVSVYGSYTISHDRTYSNMFITSAQDEPFMGGQMDVVVWDTTKLVRNSQDATGGLDIKLNEKTSIGASITYNGSNASSADVNQSDYTILPDSVLLFNGTINATNKWKNGIASMYIEREMKDGGKVNVDMDYLYFSNSNPSDVQSSFLNEDGKQAETGDSLYAPYLKTFANTVIRVGVAKIDYTGKLSQKVKLETGLKGTYTRDSSVSGIESMENGAWTVGSETAANIAMKEGIGAVYASVNAQINPSANLVVGARYEYSHTGMDNPRTGENLIDRKLGVLFPDIFFSKKLNGRADLQLSYTKRISRPSYNDLASFVGYSDPSAVYTGNPLLQPTITSNIKLGYNYRGYSFSLLFSRDTDPIARYQLTESPDKDLLYVSPQNVSYQNNITFQANLPWKVNNWWNMNYGFVGGLRQFKLDYTIQPLEKTYFDYSVNFSESFKLPRLFLLEISGWYNSLAYNGTIQVGGLGVLDAGIKKDLKNNGGAFQLSATDLLRGLRYNVRYGTLTQEAFSIKNHVTVNTESAVFPIIKLTYSRSFGSRGGRHPDKQAPGAGDEQDRIRKN